MDSLTQIVLGAAVGEAIAGRRAGNRAMLWGGICGTLPDLDVLANTLTDPMSALAYHRAFTHSLPFALLIAPAIGLAIHRLYGGREGPLAGAVLWPALLLYAWLLLWGGSYLMPVEVYRLPAITLLIVLVFSSSFAVAALLRWWRGRPPSPIVTSWRTWTLLAFGAVVTHPLLDCFTAYGTQFWQPVASTRVAWNTISVADPLYTLPFLLLLLWARTQERGKTWRARANGAGLVVSSLYLGLTVINYYNVEEVFTESLQQAGITADEQVISPTILNNILWSGTARDAGTGDYYYSQYSLFDRQRRFQPFVRIDGRHELLAPYVEDRDVTILRWFTKDFYSVLPGDRAGSLQLNDLRYGLLDPQQPDQAASYIFSWTIDTTVHPVRVRQQNAGPREDSKAEDLLQRLWTRLRGI